MGVLLALEPHRQDETDLIIDLRINFDIDESYFWVASKRIKSYIYERISVIHLS